jgi:hypothetical protein
MSVLVIAKFQGDTAKFRQALTDRADEFAKIADRARTQAGGIHHRFGVGNGFVVVVDEWESVRTFPEVLRRSRPSGVHRLGRRRPGSARDHRGRGSQSTRPVLSTVRASGPGGSRGGVSA